MNELSLYIFAGVVVALTFAASGAESARAKRECLTLKTPPAPTLEFRTKPPVEAPKVYVR